MTNEPDKVKGRAAMEAARKPPCAALDWTDSGTLSIEISGNYGRIFAAAGNEPVVDGLIEQAAVLGSHGKQIDAKATDFTLGFVDSMEPQDAAEALLCMQMAAIHQSTMMLARRLNHVENIPQQDAAERALNKLARTFSAQMDTLKRYRSKGQQTVRVERVTVQEGGQAIVGAVETGGRGRDEK